MIGGTVPDYSDLVPSQLKPSWSDGTNLKPSLTTSNYSGGTPSAANEVKPALLNSDGSLKPAILDQGEIKMSALAEPTFLAAYSPSRIVNPNYSGPLFRVKRDSDDAEDDFGVTSGGLLDESALTTFVGAGIGYVMTIYDQAGGADLVQQGFQWRIVDAGTVVKLNSTPVLLSSGANTSYLSSGAGISFSDGLTYCGLTRWSVNAAAAFQFGTINQDGSVFRLGDITARGQSGGDATQALALNTLAQVSAEIVNARRRVWINGTGGTAEETSQTVDLSSGELRLGALAATTYRFAGYMGDQLFFSGQISPARRAAIEADQSSFYGLS